MEKREIDTVPSVFPTWQIIANSFAIRNSTSNIGTAFTVDYEGIEYIVTAKHVLPLVAAGGKVEILKDNQWQKFSIESVHESENEELDIIALKLTESLRGKFFTPCEIAKSNENLIFGCDTVYVGFPASWISNSTDFVNTYTTKHAGYPYPMPFIKRSYICYSGSTNDVPHYYIDGIANRGFSGSPVYATKMRNEKGGIRTWTEIVGVIVKHKFDAGAIYNPDTNVKQPDKVQMYSGTSVAHGIYGLFNEDFVKAQ